jgi:uncharacterized protein YndB with AHSA1/START domain
MFGFLFGKKKEPANDTGSSELLVFERMIPLSQAAAFTLFVDKLGSWWPREATWAKDRLAEIGIEPRMDGHCYEKRDDGSTTQWGTVLTFARPEHIVFAWQINFDRSFEPSVTLASRVDFRFTGKGPEETQLLLVHRDFPRHGPGWQKYRSNLASKAGWPLILDRYAAAAATGG